VAYPIRKAVMLRLTLISAVLLAAAALPATAHAASGFGGTYKGTSTEGIAVTVQITDGGDLKSISGAAVATLKCHRHDGTQPFPNDETELPDKSGPFTIDTTKRGSVPGSQFFVGTPEKGEGDGVENSAEGRFETKEAGKPFINLRMSYEEVSDSAPQKETRCFGTADATLERTSTAAAGGRSVKLRRPANLAGSIKASVPALASLGDDGIGISAKTTSKAAGGKIKVAVRRDPDSRDKLGFGSGVLGSKSKKVGARRTTAFNVDVKRPRKTPSSGDSVPMLITVTFEDKRGKERSATTRVVVK
jgi:hypothetical protein